MDKYTYNHDKLNTWKTCRRRYYYKYVKEFILPEPENIYALGKDVHALIYYYLKGFDISKLLNNAEDETKIHWEALKRLPLLKNKLVAAEWGFNSRIGESDYWFIGRIDAIFYDANFDRYIIADWKTGQNVPKNPETALQAMVYLYALSRARKDLGLTITPEKLSFQYIKTPDTIEVPPVIYSSEKEKIFEEDFLRTISIIEAEREFSREQECPIPKFCQYKSLCFKD